MEINDLSHSQSTQTSGVVKRLDMLTAKRISREIQNGIEDVRRKFLSKRKNKEKIHYK